MSAGALSTLFTLFLISRINGGISLLNEVFHATPVKLRSGAASNETKTAITIAGDTLTLECQFHICNVEWCNIQWVKYGREDVQETKTPAVLPSSIVSTNGSVSSVSLTKLRRHDEGRYSCILATLTGAPKSYKFNITVKDNPSCVKNICSPNGRCLESEDGYDCICSKGFVGTNCQLVDPCLDSPCLNNGTCSTYDDGFKCICDAGFNGTLCEMEVCTQDICGRDATCNIINEKRKCSCLYNKAGDRCQYTCRFNSRYCSYTTCLITLQNGRPRERCQCDRNRRYGNWKCMMASDVRNECEAPNICNGRGNCYDHIFGYRCACQSYASGKHCEFYNECSANNHVCNINGGTCVDLTNGYKCTNCPKGQTGDKCQYKQHPCIITCQSTSMLVQCDMRFLNSKMRNIPIYFNTKSRSCRFRNTHYDGRYYYDSRERERRRLNWRMNVSYRDCGTETEYIGDHVVYTNRLRAGDFRQTHHDHNAIITRDVGHFSFQMECKLPLVRNATKRLTDYSLLRNESKDDSDARDIGTRGTYVEIYSAGNRTQKSSYVVGDRLYVKMGINADNNPALSGGYKLYPITCYATPDQYGNRERYMLMEDGCILDETFRLEKEQIAAFQGRQTYFSFDSFSFKSNPGKLYLHCTSRACVDPKPASARNESCVVTCKRSSGEQDTTTSPLSTDLPSIVNGTIDRAPGSNIEVFTSTTSVEE